MSVYLLDTDTITLAQFGQTSVMANFARHSLTEIAIPVISVQEQMRGWLGRLAGLKTPRQQADWHDRFVNRMFPIWRQFQFVSFSEVAIRRFEHLRTLRLNVGLMDLRIAATALENGLTVVTANQRDFRRVPGLTTVDWSV